MSEEKIKQKNWKLGTNCFFAKYGSLNQLYFSIIDWYQNDPSVIKSKSPNEACLVILPAIPNACHYHKSQAHSELNDHLSSRDPDRDLAIPRKYVTQWFHQIPSWRDHNNNGANHIVIDFYDNDDRGPWDSSGRIYNTTSKALEWSDIYPHATMDAGNAMIIGSNLDRRYYRPDFDIPIPLIHIPFQNDDPRIGKTIHLTPYENSCSDGIPPFVSATKRREDVILSNSLINKRHLICFVGTVYQTSCCPIRNIFLKISEQIQNSSFLYLPKIHSYNYTEYYEMLSQCVYGLVLSGKGYHSFRLLELLSLGVIPFIVRNPHYVLPFEGHWRWERFSLVYQEEDFTAQNWTILSKMISFKESDPKAHQQMIIELQNEGKKFYRKYLEDKKDLWKTIVKEIHRRVDAEMARRRDQICGVS
jgi:hypothetical protein